MAIAFQMVTNGNVPATGQTPGTIFFEENATNDGFRLYNTNAAGVPIAADYAAGSAANGLTIDYIATDITARDALVAGTLATNGNAFVYVTDASADGTVTAGGALYLFNDTGDTFVKVSEAESLDVAALNYTAQNW